MGLDSVELIIKVEETFVISITDEEAGRIETVGDFHQLIMEHLARPVPEIDVLNERVCFHRARKCLREIALIPREAIRPQANLGDLIEPPHRRAAWKQLAECWDLDLPPLRGTPLLRAIIISAFLVPMTALIPLSLFMRKDPLTFLVPAAGIACALFLNWGTRSLRREFPPGWSRVSDIVKRMHLRDYPHAARPQLSGADQVYELLKELIIEQLGVDESEVEPEARFVKDLGID